MAALFPNTRCTEPGLADVPRLDFDFVLGSPDVLPVPEPILDVPEPYLPIDPADIPVPAATITSITIGLNGFLTVYGPTNFYASPVVINSNSSLTVYGPSIFAGPTVYNNTVTFTSTLIIGGPLTINNQTFNSNNLIKVWARITARYEVAGKYLYDAIEAEALAPNQWQDTGTRTWDAADNPLWERNSFPIDVGEHVEVTLVGVDSAPTIAITGAAEDWTVTVLGGGGTFTLTVTIAANSQVTAAIPFGASAAVVEAALEALPNVGIGNVVVAGDGVPGNPYTLDFAAPLDANGLEGDADALDAYETWICDYEGGDTDTVEVVTSVECVDGVLTVNYGNITFTKGSFRGIA